MFLPLHDGMVDRVTAHLGTRALVRLGRTSRALRAQISPLLPLRLSVERIRRFFRWCRYVSSTRVVVARFRNAGLASASQDEELFGNLVTSPSVVIATGEFLMRMYRQSRLSIRPREDSTLVTRLSVSEFMYMYAIRYHPSTLFEREDDTAAALRVAAHALVRCVDMIVAHVTANGPFLGRDRPDLAAFFPLLVDHYRRAYNVWRSPSPIERIKAALRMLLRAQASLPAAVAPQRLQELADQIGFIRARLAGLFGEAALAEFDREEEEGGL
jgi:hypothetical protein